MNYSSFQMCPDFCPICMYYDLIRYHLGNVTSAKKNVCLYSLSILLFKGASWTVALKAASTERSKQKCPS
jgi:hypothetical protein